MRTEVFIKSALLLLLCWGMHIFLMYEKKDFYNLWRFSLMGHQLIICVLFYLWQTKGLKDEKID